MKTKSISLLLVIILHQVSLAQQLETIYINELVSTHFITSESIQYVDISNEHIVGDMPVSNILRLRPRQTEALNTKEQGMLTIVCQKYLVQYQLQYAEASEATKSKFISSRDGKGLLLPEITISTEEMRKMSWQLISQPKTKPVKRSSYYRMKMILNRVHSSGDYYFIDLSIQNRSNITFNIDQLRFHIRDKTVLKATNHQQVELIPEYVLYTQNKIQKS